jgi:hypothetical protein
MQPTSPILYKQRWYTPTSYSRAGPRFSAKASKKIKGLKSWRNQRKEEMGIDSALVCSQTQIESLALSSPKSLNDLDSIDTLRKWQKKQFGRKICCLLKRFLLASPSPLAQLNFHTYVLYVLGLMMLVKCNTPLLTNAEIALRFEFILRFSSIPAPTAT